MRKVPVSIGEFGSSGCAPDSFIVGVLLKLPMRAGFLHGIPIRFSGLGE